MISTHILDTHVGLPAGGVPVTLFKKAGENWIQIDNNATNNDGRIVFNCPAENGVYKLDFEVENYFESTTDDYFFPTAQIVFRIKDTDRKYHVPLLLNPFGYSTYRGS